MFHNHPSKQTIEKHEPFYVYFRDIMTKTTIEKVKYDITPKLLDYNTAFSYMVKERNYFWHTKSSKYVVESWQN